jgi:hypothetical protein
MTLTPERMLEVIAQQGSPAHIAEAHRLATVLQANPLDQIAIAEAEALFEAFLHEPYLTRNSGDITAENPSTQSRGLEVTYFVIAGLGLLITAVLNVQGTVQGLGNPFAIWFANATASSLAVDLLIVASAASIFIIIEGKRLEMKRPWLYVAVSFVTAVAFAFPLFLAMRERRIRAAAHTHKD